MDVRVSGSAERRIRPCRTSPSPPRVVDRALPGARAPAPVSYEDSISPEHYELERKAIFAPHLAERRPGRAAAARRELLHQGARRRPHLDRRGALSRRRGPRLPQHLPPPRQQARVAGLPGRGDERARAGSSRASTTAGATPSRVTSPSCSRRREFFDLDKADYGLAPVQVEMWEGFIFVNLDPSDTTPLREYLGELGRGLEGYPFDEMTQVLQVPRRGRQQLEAVHRRLRRVLPRTDSAREAGRLGGVGEARGLRLRGARVRDRRSARHGVVVGRHVAAEGPQHGEADRARAAQRAVRSVGARRSRSTCRRR